MKFQYHQIDDWPPLAWLVKCQAGSDDVHVWIGPGLEVRDDWFGELVWAGEFADANFDQTDLVFGSGGRLRPDGVFFVSSGTTVDRLHSLARDGTKWVSNSLSCVAAAAGVSFDPAYSRYDADFNTIVEGLDKYQQYFPTTNGQLRLTYFHNLCWSGQQLVEVNKPEFNRDFSTFAKYREFLVHSLQEIARNLKASQRVHPFQLLGTISSGYDSPTVAVLGREAGLKEIISFQTGRKGESDSGEAIAEQLGLRSHVFSSFDWKKYPLSEVPGLAADCLGEQVFFRGAEPLFSGKVLLTGFHGDKLWAKKFRDLSPNIARGDRSGLSLSEYRLQAGFIHLPVPFMGVRQIRDVHAITNSAEMSPWDVARSYSRPICRRIVEEAGVDRDSFGTSKVAAAILFTSWGERRLSDDVVTDLQHWLRQRHAARWTNTPFRESMCRVLAFPNNLVIRSLFIAGNKLGPPLRERLISLGKRYEKFWRYRIDLISFTFPWAVEHMKRRYNTNFSTTNADGLSGARQVNSAVPS